MGPRVAEGLRGPKTLPPVVADVIKSMTGLASHIICLYHALSGQRSPHHRKRNNTNGQNYEATISSLFCFEGIDQVQNVLLRGGEDLLRSRHERKKALTLFRGPQHKSANKPTVERHLRQQRQLQTNQ
jgi:hypothetical protein